MATLFFQSKSRGSTATGLSEGGGGLKSTASSHHSNDTTRKRNGGRGGGGGGAPPGGVDEEGGGGGVSKSTGKCSSGDGFHFCNNNNNNTNNKGRRCSFTAGIRKSASSFTPPSSGGGGGVAPIYQKFLKEAMRKIEKLGDQSTLTLHMRYVVKEAMNDLGKVSSLKPPPPPPPSSLPNNNHNAKAATGQGAAVHHHHHEPSTSTKEKVKIDNQEQHPADSSTTNRSNHNSSTISLIKNKEGGDGVVPSVTDKKDSNRSNSAMTNRHNNNNKNSNNNNNNSSSSIAAQSSSQNGSHNNNNVGQIEMGVEEEEAAAAPPSAPPSPRGSTCFQSHEGLGGVEGEEKKENITKDGNNNNNIDHANDAKNTNAPATSNSPLPERPPPLTMTEPTPAAAAQQEQQGLLLRGLSGNSSSSPSTTAAVAVQETFLLSLQRLDVEDEGSLLHSPLNAETIRRGEDAQQQHVTASTIVDVENTTNSNNDHTEEKGKDKIDEDENYHHSKQDDQKKKKIDLDGTLGRTARLTAIEEEKKKREGGRPSGGGLAILPLTAVEEEEKEDEAFSSEENKTTSDNQSPLSFFLQTTLGDKDDDDDEDEDEEGRQGAGRARGRQVKRHPSLLPAHSSRSSSFSDLREGGERTHHHKRQRGKLNNDSLATSHSELPQEQRMQPQSQLLERLLSNLWSAILSAFFWNQRKLMDLGMLALQQLYDDTSVESRCCGVTLMAGSLASLGAAGQPGGRAVIGETGVALDDGCGGGGGGVKIEADGRVTCSIHYGVYLALCSFLSRGAQQSPCTPQQVAQTLRLLKDMLSQPLSAAACAAQALVRVVRCGFSTVVECSDAEMRGLAESILSLCLTRVSRNFLSTAVATPTPFTFRTRTKLDNYVDDVEDDDTFRWIEILAAEDDGWEHEYTQQQQRRPTTNIRTPVAAAEAAEGDRFCGLKSNNTNITNSGGGGMTTNEYSVSPMRGSATPTKTETATLNVPPAKSAGSRLFHSLELKLTNQILRENSGNNNNNNNNNNNVQEGREEEDTDPNRSGERAGRAAGGSSHHRLQCLTSSEEVGAVATDARKGKNNSNNNNNGKFNLSLTGLNDTSGSINGGDAASMVARRNNDESNSIHNPTNNGAAAGLANSVSNRFPFPSAKARNAERQRSYNPQHAIKTSLDETLVRQVDSVLHQDGRIPPALKEYLFCLRLSARTAAGFRAAALAKKGSFSAVPLEMPEKEVRERQVGLRMMDILLSCLPCCNCEYEHPCATWLSVVLMSCRYDLIACIARNMLFEKPFSLFKSSTQILLFLLRKCHYALARELHTLLASFVFPLVASPYSHFRQKFAILQLIEELFGLPHVIVSYYINYDCSPSFDPNGEYRGMLQLMVAFVTEMMMTEQLKEEFTAPPPPPHRKLGKKESAAAAAERLRATPRGRLSVEQQRLLHHKCIGVIQTLSESMFLWISEDPKATAKAVISHEGDNSRFHRCAELGESELLMINLDLPSEEEDVDDGAAIMGGGGGGGEGLGVSHNELNSSAPWKRRSPNVPNSPTTDNKNHNAVEVQQPLFSTLNTGLLNPYLNEVVVQRSPNNYQKYLYGEMPMRCVQSSLTSLRSLNEHDDDDDDVDMLSCSLDSSKLRFPDCASPHAPRCIIHYHWKHIHHLRQNKAIAVEASRLISEGRWKDAKCFLEQREYIPTLTPSAEEMNGHHVPPGRSSYSHFTRFLFDYPHIDRQAIQRIFERVNKANEPAALHIAREYFHLFDYRDKPVDIAFRDTTCRFVSWDRPMFEAQTWETLQRLFGEEYAAQNPRIYTAQDAETLAGVMLFLHSSLHNPNAKSSSMMTMTEEQFIQNTLDCLDFPMEAKEVRAIYRRMSKMPWALDAYGRTPAEAERANLCEQFSERVWRLREARVAREARQHRIWEASRESGERKRVLSNTTASSATLSSPAQSSATIAVLDATTDGRAGAPTAFPTSSTGVGVTSASIVSLPNSSTVNTTANNKDKKANNGEKKNPLGTTTTDLNGSVSTMGMEDMLTDEGHMSTAQEEEFSTLSAAGGAGGGKGIPMPDPAMATDTAAHSSSHHDTNVPRAGGREAMRNLFARGVEDLSELDPTAPSYCKGIPVIKDPKVLLKLKKDTGGYFTVVATERLINLEARHQVFFMDRHLYCPQPYIPAHYAEHVRPMLLTVSPSLLACLYVGLRRAEEAPVYHDILRTYRRLTELCTAFVIRNAALHEAVEATLKEYLQDQPHAVPLRPPVRAGFVFHSMIV